MGPRVEVNYRRQSSITDRDDPPISARHERRVEVQLQLPLREEQQVQRSWGKGIIRQRDIPPAKRRSGRRPIPGEGLPELMHEGFSGKIGYKPTHSLESWRRNPARKALELPKPMAYALPENQKLRNGILNK